MFDLIFPRAKAHRYYLFCSGAKLKSKYYETRRDAEIAMFSFCNSNNINIECTEMDKHERKYSNHNGIRFYINRV